MRTKLVKRPTKEKKIWTNKEMRELVKWAFDMGTQTSSKKFFKEEMEKKLK